MSAPGARPFFRVRLDHPGPFFVTQDYDLTGQMTAIREDGTTLLATFGYDQLGRRERLTLGNGAITDYQYDGASRLWKLKHNPAGLGTTNDNEITFTYNPAGQIVGAWRPTTPTPGPATAAAAPAMRPTGSTG